MSFLWASILNLVLSTSSGCTSIAVLAANSFILVAFQCAFISSKRYTSKQSDRKVVVFISCYLLLRSALQSLFIPGRYDHHSASLRRYVVCLLLSLGGGSEDVADTLKYKQMNFRI